VHQPEENDCREDCGDTDSMHHFIPGIVVLVIVLRHVLLESWHGAPPVPRSRAAEL